MASEPKPAGMDEPRGVRGAAAGAPDARGQGSGGQAGVPDQGVRRGHHVARPRGVPTAGVGGALSSAMACGTRYKISQANVEDGRAAVQDPGDGAEGDLGPFPGVQPDPWCDGGGGELSRVASAGVELARGEADGGG